MNDQPLGDTMTNEWKGRTRLATLSFVLLVTASGCAAPGRLLRGYAEADPSEMELLEPGGALADAPAHIQGQVRFTFDGFGSLSTDGLKRSALPFKLVVAAVALDRHDTGGDPVTLNTAYEVFEESGFLRPHRIANWEGRQPRMERPLGVVSAIAERGFPSVALEIASLGCTTCHAGALYGADGRPTGDVWLGLPNASMDVSGLGRTLSLALERQLPRSDALLEAMVEIFPRVSDEELAVMRKHVIPGAQEKLAAQIAEHGREPPFEHGGPGLMNGVAGVRNTFGLLDPHTRATNVGWVSPPDLSETTMRKSLLVDGVYVPVGSDRFGPRTRDEVAEVGLSEFADMATLFILTTFAVEPEAARDEVGGVHDLVSFLDQMRPPPFPGIIDTALAAQGEQVYRAACAACHGTYSRGPTDVRLLVHPNRLVAQDRMHTDSARWAAADSTSLATLAGLGWGDQIAAESFGGYVAPDLSGVWATAPYLHNGSIPTLWHLMNADEHPDRFMVGGHDLDYELVGIRGAFDDCGDYLYPDGFEPWSRPTLYDTSEPERSNAGHEFPGAIDRSEEGAARIPEAAVEIGRRNGATHRTWDPRTHGGPHVSPTFHLVRRARQLLDRPGPCIREIALPRCR